MEERMVYVDKIGNNRAQCFIKIDGHKEYLQDRNNRIGLPLLSYNRGITYYTVYKGKKVELKCHPYDKAGRF